MDNTEFTKYVDLLMSMSLDFKLGKLDRKMYEYNLRSIVNQMAPLMCTCDKCLGIYKDATVDSQLPHV